MRRAVWWAWLRQDMWAAFRASRSTLVIWYPKKSLEDLGPDEYATRIVYIAARVVQFAGMEAAASAESMQQWIDNGNKFKFLPCGNSVDDHFAMTTLLTNMPSIYGVYAYRTRQRELDDIFRVICGIASHDFDQGFLVFVNIQALYAGDLPPSHTWKGRTQTLGDSWAMCANFCEENSSF